MAELGESYIPWETPTPSLRLSMERRKSKFSVSVDITSRAYRPDWKLYLGFGWLCVLVLASALDATVLLAGLPAVISKLNGGTIEAIWISTSYHLASSIFQPLFVSISFICGRKPLLAASAVFATAGCVVCGIASNANILILGRALQGAGGGASIALAEVITSDIIPAEFRLRWLMVLNVAWAIGTAGGPVLGAVLVGGDSWKLVFWLSIGLHVAGGIVPMILTIDLKKPKSIGNALSKFDWGGVILFICSSTTISASITLGGSIYPWSSWRMILLLTLAASSTILFLVLESFYIRNPFIDLWRLKDVTGLTTFLCDYLHSFIFWSLLTFLPIYYQSIKDLTPIETALALLPETASTIPAFVIFGFIISRTARYKWILFGSWALTSIGAGFVALLDTTTSTTVWIIVNILSGVGIGIIFSGLTFASQATATAMKQDFAFGSSMLHFFRACGAASGIATSGTTFQHEFFESVSSIPAILPDAAEYTRRAFDFALNFPTTLNEGDRANLVEAYASGLKKIWLTAGILAIVGAIVCVFADEYGNHVYSRVRDDKETGRKKDSVIMLQEV